MIGVTAILTAKAGSETAFEKVFAELIAQVRAHESANKLYTLTKSRTEPRTYLVMELYDDAGLEAHRRSDHYKAGGRAMRDLVEAPPKVEVHYVVA